MPPYQEKAVEPFETPIPQASIAKNGSLKLSDIDYLPLYIRMHLRSQRFVRYQINRTPQQIFNIELNAKIPL